MRRNRRRRGQLTYRRVGEMERIYHKRKKNRVTMRIVVSACAVVLIVTTIIGGSFLLRDTEQSVGSGAVKGTSIAELLQGIEETQESGVAAVGGMVEPDAQQSAGTQGVNTQGVDEQGTDAHNTDSQDATETAGAQEADWIYSSDDRPKVKGIYVTGPMAGNNAFENLLTLVDDTELNAMVIDVKNDAGEITYRMSQETAQEMGACINYIRDMENFMKKLKEHGVYTIARIVCFKDPYLAEHHPELALKKPDGTAIVDGHGLAWVNPYKEEVWEYLVDVARKAGEIGFDEIQFDYVRFPIGSDAEAADYGVDRNVYTKEQAITGFLTYAAEELHKEGIPVTADVFGTIIGSETDVQQVGQDYAELGNIVDAICPMVYPSHYGNGVFGLSVPDAYPYETVYEAMKDSVEELADIPKEQQAVVRPWLQAFTATWVEGYISYGGDQIRAQIQAVYDAGYEEWILWNASNHYSGDGLLSE